MKEGQDQHADTRGRCFASMGNVPSLFGTKLSSRCMTDVFRIQSCPALAKIVAAARRYYSLMRIFRSLIGSA